MISKKKKIYFLATLTLIFITLTLTILINNTLSLKIEEKSYFTSVTITPGKGGIDLNSSALTFGTITPDGSSTRNLVFENKFNFPIIAKASVKGDIAELLSFEKEILIGSNKTEKIAFSAIGSKAKEIKNYSGIVRIRVYKAR